MKIIIADDNKIFREALVLFLEQELNNTILAEYSSGLELLNNKLLASADLLLIDIEMPGLNGIQTMRKINNEYSWAKAIAITDYHEKAYLKDLITHGFKGCVFKDSIFKNLEKALKKVHNGGVSFPIDMTLD